MNERIQTNMHSFKVSRFILILSFSSLVSSALFGVLTIILLNDGPLSIIKNSVAGMKICMVAALVHCLLTFLISFLYGSESSEKYPFKPKITSVVKSLFILILGCIIFYIICICYGAPLLSSTTETFHFSMLLTVLICLPNCIFCGSNLDNWFTMFTSSSANGVETVVYFTSLCSLLGAWLGAVPIPLDWDRPWQEWPISCVIGALSGYCLGLLMAAVKLPWNLRNANKSKYF
ncbi:unnamed protein product [Lymnaea stagnalis]|uniref:Phosphatidylinositol-glycan biosynthesis class F protein n=1 Tax=Lymnaea stagnalis TaxID=6523 RepID=A0AAV2IME1_LYMST